MLPIDIQAELIRSFQEEKRQRFLENQMRSNSSRASRRERVLRAAGEFLIAAGNGLQRTAGVPVTRDLDSRKLGWEK